jgi:hypothetical protein
MAWLWLMSVGVTDLQFPVWKLNEVGQWTGPWFFEPGRAGIRRLHDGILALHENGQIAFPAMPRRLQGDARELRLELELIDAGFKAEVRHSKSPNDFRISQYGNEIPNGNEPKLPLYCPKIEPLIEAARNRFGDEPVTVVALGTKRNEKFWDAMREPIASGPVVARFCAERLNLELVDNRGQMPTAFEPGTSSWVDLLIEDELHEDRTAQQKVAKRLTRIVQLWIKSTADPNVVVTPSGGIPPLKPLIERIPATCVGQNKVQLLDEPEPGPPPRAPPAIKPVDYSARVVEAETLRFYCAEALRSGDYVSAYGIARRYNLPWSQVVRNQLGSFLQLPGEPVTIEGRPLMEFEIDACRVEMSLCMGDVAGALRQLGTFMETATWHLITKDPRIRSTGLRCNRDIECLTGEWSASFSRLKLLERDGRGTNMHAVIDLTYRWPDWLVGTPMHKYSLAAQALFRLTGWYNKRPRKLRNRILHGSEGSVDLSEIESVLRSARLITNVGAPFGLNFLSSPSLKGLLDNASMTGFAQVMADYVNKLVSGVAEHV